MKIWEDFQHGINRYEVYSFNNNKIDTLLTYLEKAKITEVGKYHFW